MTQVASHRAQHVLELVPVRRRAPRYETTGSPGSQVNRDGVSARQGAGNATPPATPLEVATRSANTAVVGFLCAVTVPVLMQVE